MGSIFAERLYRAGTMLSVSAGFFMGRGAVVCPVYVPYRSPKRETKVSIPAAMPAPCYAPGSC